MPFRQLDPTVLPARQWSLTGYPAAGKSTFAAQMRGPILAIDADHRFSEVASNVKGDVFKLSDDPADNVSPHQIGRLLREGMSGSGVKTIVFDSLTSVITPMVVEAILANDAGKNKNRVAAFKDKALAMRMLQDVITGLGVDVLWIYHQRNGLDGQARQVETSTISAVELARLRRSLNMQLRIVEQGHQRGVKVDWARRGRAGVTLWDDTGAWLGMPERIEQAVYGGLTKDDMDAIEKRTPTVFTGPEDAIAYGVEVSAFNDAVHAQNAYHKLKAEYCLQTAASIWKLWVDNVQEPLAQRN